MQEENEPSPFQTEDDELVIKDNRDLFKQLPVDTAFHDITVNSMYPQIGEANSLSMLVCTSRERSHRVGRKRQESKRKVIIALNRRGFNGVILEIKYLNFTQIIG